MNRAATQTANADQPAQTTGRPRVLIEDWLPAAAIGVECIRERSTGQQPPDKRLHVWWARRPLCASRAAVLASLLPADFPRDAFERLLGFGHPGSELVAIRRLMDTGYKVPGGFNCDRAFKANLPPKDLDAAHEAATEHWGDDICVVDPMAGGGSIPLESARLGFRTVANEYNPVACSVLEATIDYPFRFGPDLATKARRWAREWLKHIEKRLASFYPEHKQGLVHAYVFARIVPCPDTGFDTPLVPDWHLLKPKSGQRLVAVPQVDREDGTWRITAKPVGRGAGQIKEPPPPSYDHGKGISLFSGEMVNGVWQGRQIPADYIKAMAQQGKMKSALYAVVIKTASGLKFAPPEPEDLTALAAAEDELARLRSAWEKSNIIPREDIPVGEKTGEPRARGITHWADMFTPRQLLCMGVLVEELRKRRPEIVKVEGEELGEAIVHLLAFAIDKMANYNNYLASWHAPRQIIRSLFDRHDYSFKTTITEMAPCNAGVGLDWAVSSVVDAYDKLATLPRYEDAKPVEITLGSATNLPHIGDGSIAAVVVDPPYDDNVQYSELADFFYVWLKRTQGHRRPEWFSTYLCEHDQEAVVNAVRFKDGKKKTAEAKTESRAFYCQLMTDVFRECHRVLRDDGVLTVMFTHKKQEAWEALFTSLIDAGFTITATWPVKTESEHSLHQAKKNAAQSTVILVARKRAAGAGVGYFDSRMEQDIRDRARETAERLRNEGLNAIDQLVGSFGPAMEVYSRHDNVRTDTGNPVGVSAAIEIASDAVSAWRIEQLAERGLEGVEPEGQFYLLCWDVLGAAEFRFNEAKLLGHAVGMDVDQLIVAGLVTKSSDKINILSARVRRRERPLEPDQVEELLFETVLTQKKHKKKDVLEIHPNDARFRTALDACHALALRYTEAGAGKGGIGSAKALARQQNWSADSAVAKLMQALINAAPDAVKFDKGKKSAAALFPEFRAWHSLLPELFAIEPPKWEEMQPAQAMLAFGADDESEDMDDEGAAEEHE